MGHELGGSVATVGPGAEDWSEGVQAAVLPVASCGRCAAVLVEPYAVGLHTVNTADIHPGDAVPVLGPVRRASPALHGRFDVLPHA